MPQSPCVLPDGMPQSPMWRKIASGLPDGRCAGASSPGVKGSGPARALRLEKLSQENPAATIAGVHHYGVDVGNLSKEMRIHFIELGRKVDALSFQMSGELLSNFCPPVVHAVRGPSSTLSTSNGSHWVGRDETILIAPHSKPSQLDAGSLLTSTSQPVHAKFTEGTVQTVVTTDSKPSQLDARSLPTSTSQPVHAKFTEGTVQTVVTTDCTVNASRTASSNKTASSPKLHAYRTASRRTESEQRANAQIAIDAVIDVEPCIVTAQITAKHVIQGFSHSNLDIIMCAIICLDIIVMFANYEWAGYKAATALDLVTPSNFWQHASVTFAVMEVLFAMAYTAELVVRAKLKGLDFFKTTVSLVDIFMVITSWSSIIVSSSDAVSSSESTEQRIRVLGVVRCLKFLRLSRMCRVLALNPRLRVVATVVCDCIGALVWPMVLVLLLTLSSGLAMCALLQNFIADSDAVYADRLWVYYRYGSSSRAVYTMFEATLSGCWPSYARKLKEDVHPSFALFFFTYVLLVVFAVVSVVRSLFLKEVMQRANSDAEIVQKEKDKKRCEYMCKVTEAFHHLDVSGDGTLDIEEFVMVVEEPSVKARLHAMDIDVSDAKFLFEVLDDGNGEVTLDEFATGLSRVCGHAKSLDLLELRSQCKKLQYMMIDMVRVIAPDALTAYESQ